MASKNLEQCRQWLIDSITDFDEVFFLKREEKIFCESLQDALCVREGKQYQKPYNDSGYHLGEGMVGCSVIHNNELTLGYSNFWFPVKDVIPKCKWRALAVKLWARSSAGQGNVSWCIAPLLLLGADQVIKINENLACGAAIAFLL
jgi:hypothetical protein